MSVAGIVHVWDLRVFCFFYLVPAGCYFVIACVSLSCVFHMVRVFIAACICRGPAGFFVSLVFLFV